MSSFKDKIAGGFDLLLLFGRGINKFSGTKEEALKSIAVPVLVYAGSFAFGIVYPPKGMETGYGTTQIVVTMLAQFVLSFVFSSLVIAQFFRWLGRGDKFWLYFSATNWTSIPVGLASLPLVVLAAKGIVPRDQMDRIFVVVQLYTYLITACIVYSALRLNWELAAGMAITTMFIDQQVWHILYMLQHIPNPW